MIILHHLVSFILQSTIHFEHYVCMSGSDLGRLSLYVMECFCVFRHPCICFLKVLLLPFTKVLKQKEHLQKDILQKSDEREWSQNYSILAPTCAKQHLTCDKWHMTNDIWHLILFLNFPLSFLHFFLYFIVLVLLAAHINRFSVSLKLGLVFKQLNFCENSLLISNWN